MIESYISHIRVGIYIYIYIHILGVVLNTFRNSPGSFRNSSAKLTEIPFKEAKGPLNSSLL